MKNDQLQIRVCMYCSRSYGCNNANTTTDCIKCRDFSGCNLRFKIDTQTSHGICPFCAPLALAAAAAGTTFVHFRQLQANHA